MLDIDENFKQLIRRLDSVKNTLEEIVFKYPSFKEDSDVLKALDICSKGIVFYKDYAKEKGPAEFSDMLSSLKAMNKHILIFKKKIGNKNVTWRKTTKKL